MFGTFWKTNPFEIGSSKSPEMEWSDFRSQLNNKKARSHYLFWNSDTVALVDGRVSGLVFRYADLLVTSGA